MFCDETKILVIAGHGGDGSVSFRREKYVPKGGPDGGDGGQGGNIILKANENINTLSDINSHKHYKAESGGAGHKKNMSGKTGEDLILQVPVGTVIWNIDKSKIITDLSSHNQEFIITKGGKGGLGNQHFASSVNQAPTFAETGEPGEEKEILLELKLVADVGLVGFPSVGKSTLIAHVSNARPKIAEYEFTTLVPNLGVVDMKRFGGGNSDAFVIADIPGIIEGASHGKGLGLKFLRHIARNSVLIHIVDPLRPNPIENFKIIQHELELSDKSLIKKPLIVAINKIDAVQPKEVEKITKELLENIKPKPKKIFPISSVTGKGLKELLFEALKEIRNTRQSSPREIKSQETIILTPHKELVKFKIEQVKKKKTHKIFIISGQRIEQVLRMTDLNNPQGVERVYHFLNKMGILKAVKREKAEISDIIEIAGKHIPYRD
ncbi:MAG: GTPase ObgE [Candidatus Gracilibacteria bacterium]